MRPDRLTVLAFASFVVFAGAGTVAIRLGSFELPPFWAASLRYALAVGVFFGIAAILRIPFPRGRNLLGALIMSVTYMIATALTYVGVGASSATMGALVFALTPLVTLSMAAAVGIERFTMRGATGAAVAALGIVVVVGDQLGSAIQPSALLALGGAMIFAAATAVVIKRVPPGHPITANAVGGAFVLPMLLGLSILQQESWALPDQRETWLALAFLVVFGTVLLFPLALFIIGRWTASGYAYTGLFKPLAGVALAALLLGEAISASSIAGASLVFAGVWLGAFRGPPIPVGEPSALARGLEPTVSHRRAGG